MALIKCEECGKEISDKSKKCPNCGAPNKIQIKKDNFTIAILVPIFLLLFLASMFIIHVSIKGGL